MPNPVKYIRYLFKTHLIYSQHTIKKTKNTYPWDPFTCMDRGIEREREKMKPSWAILKGTLVDLRARWVHLGAILSYLGAMLGNFSGILRQLCHLGAVLGYLGEALGVS